MCSLLIDLACAENALTSREKGLIAVAVVLGILLVALAVVVVALTLLLLRKNDGELIIILGMSGEFFLVHV